MFLLTGKINSLVNFKHLPNSNNNSNNNIIKSHLKHEQYDKIDNFWP